MILLIDNYDSFTYNLVQRLGEMDREIQLEVVRNDKISADQIAELVGAPSGRPEATSPFERSSRKNEFGAARSPASAAPRPRQWPT